MAAQPPVQPTTRNHRGPGGFTLVEVALALGITVFVCVSMLGVLPVGISTFRQATGLTVEAQIVQNLSNDLLLANFSDLYQYNQQHYYYDVEGVPLKDTTGALFNASVTMAPVNKSNSPTDLIDAGVPTSVVLPTDAMTTSAYRVSISVVSVANPSLPHLYTVIIANNNL